MKFYERREFPRAPASLTVQYQNGEALTRDLVADQSAGGLFIRTRKPLPIGSEFDLVIEIDGEKEGDVPRTIKVRGRVVWERLYGHAAPPHEPEGMGIQFVGEVDPRLLVPAPDAPRVPDTTKPPDK